MPKPTSTTPEYIKKTLLELAREVPAVGLNYAAHLTGITSVQAHSNLSLEQFHSPKARAKILKDYEQGIKVKGLIQPVDELLKSVKTQLDEIRSKATGLEEFKKQIEGDDTLTEDQKKAKIDFCESVETSLSKTRLVTLELQDFQKRMEIVSDLLKKDEIDNPSVIIAYIDDEYHKLIKQLEKDKELALNEVDEWLGKISPLKTGIPMSDKELADMQTGMKKRITDSYDKARTELDTLYEKGTPAATEKDKAVPGLRERFVKTADQAEQELINLVLYAEHTDSKALPSSTNLSAGAGAVPNKNDPRRYRSIDFDEYLNAKLERETGWFTSQAWSDYLKFLMNQNHELITPSGLHLNHQKNEHGETIGIAITLPANFEGYYHRYDNQLESDLLFLMNELKAKGKDEITITINIHNEELRQKIMEKAYVAAKLAGFPDDKIKFNVTVHENNEQSITGKTAQEIMGQLGQAPSIAQTIKSSWDEQKKTAANYIRAGVGALDRKVNAILKTAPIDAQADSSDDDNDSRAFKVRRI